MLMTSAQVADYDAGSEQAKPMMTGKYEVTRIQHAAWKPSNAG